MIIKGNELTHHPKFEPKFEYCVTNLGNQTAPNLYAGVMYQPKQSGSLAILYHVSFVSTFLVTVTDQRALNTVYLNLVIRPR